MPRERWNQVGIRLHPLLLRLGEALQLYGPGCSSDAFDLAKLARADAEQCFHKLNPGLIPKILQSVTDQTAHPETMRALLALTDAIKAEGLETHGIHASGVVARLYLKLKPDQPTS
jgi:hypothetical protein